MSRAFGDDDNRVASFQQAAMENGQQSAFAFKFERHFRHQGEVHFLAGQGGTGSDKAGVAAHDFYDADAILHAMRFHVG